MVLFYLVMLAALLLIIGFGNRVTDFKTAYLQSLLFLEVMNWYDGIAIDKVWVGHSKFWVLPGTEDCVGIRLRHGNFVGTARRKCKNAGGNRFFGRDDKAGEA